MKKIIYFLLLCNFGLHAQNIKSKMELIKGNNFYESGNYDTSDYNFKNSYQSDTSNIKALFNIGNASFMKGDFEGARNNFNKYINSTKNITEKANGHYNIGNSYLTQYSQQLKEGSKEPEGELLQNAIDQYKSSLRYNYNDKDARYNLSYAMRLVQQNKDQQNKDQQNKDQQNKDQQNKDQQNKDQQNKDQQNKDQQNKDQQNKDQQNKDQQKKDQQNKDQQNKDQQNKDQQKKDQQEIEKKQSKAQAMKNLDAVNSDEEKVLLKVNRKKGDQKKKSKSKDW